MGPRRAEVSRPPPSDSTTAANGSASPLSSWQCNVAGAEAVGIAAAPAAPGASIITVVCPRPGGAPWCVCCAKPCCDAPLESPPRESPAPNPPIAFTCTRLPLSFMGVGSKRRLPKGLLVGANDGAAAAETKPPPCGTGMILRRPSFPTVSRCACAVGAVVGAPGTVFATGPAPAPATGSVTTEEFSTTALPFPTTCGATRFGAFVCCAASGGAFATAGVRAGGRGDFVGVVAGGGLNFKSEGSSRMGPTRRRRSPYSFDRNARVSVSVMAHPSSLASNVKTATVPSVEHAMREYPSGDQHVSTTDCVKQVFTIHTGFGRFVAHTVILQSCEPHAMTVCGVASRAAAVSFLHTFPFSSLSLGLNSAGENLTVTTGPLCPTKSNLLPQSPLSNTDAVCEGFLYELHVVTALPSGDQSRRMENVFPMLL